MGNNDGGAAEEAQREEGPAEHMAFAERRSTEAGGMQIAMSAEGRQYRQTSGRGRSMPLPDKGEADQMPLRSPHAALKQMNAAWRPAEWVGMVPVGGAALGLAFFLLPLPMGVRLLLCALLAGVTLIVFHYARAADARWQRFHLEYQLDADARERWTLLNHALAALTRTDRLWRITLGGRAEGRQRDQGASARVARVRAALRRETPVGLTSSLTPYCLRFGAERWLFLPDRLYVLQNGDYEAVEYARLEVTAGVTRFIEEEQVPRDAQVVSRPLRRTASGGTQGIPIAQYGVLEIEAPPEPESGRTSELKATLHVSSVGAADQFAALFRSFQRFRRSDGEMPPSDAPSEDCFGRLGLLPSCTKAEATRQFRRLVLIHHPDRVTRTSPDAGERANAEMQEIVLAYKDLKRLRGW